MHVHFCSATSTATCSFLKPVVCSAWVLVCLPLKPAKQHAKVLGCFEGQPGVAFCVAGFQSSNVVLHCILLRHRSGAPTEFSSRILGVTVECCQRLFLITMCKFIVLGSLERHPNSNRTCTVLHYLIASKPKGCRDMAFGRCSSRSEPSVCRSSHRSRKTISCC